MLLSCYLTGKDCVPACAKEGRGQSRVLEGGDESVVCSGSLPWCYFLTLFCSISSSILKCRMGGIDRSICLMRRIKNTANPRRGMQIMMIVRAWNVASDIILSSGYTLKHSFYTFIWFSKYVLCVVFRRGPLWFLVCRVFSFHERWRSRV